MCVLSGNIVKDFLNKAPEQETYCEKIFDDAFIAMQDGCLVKIKRLSGHFWFVEQLLKKGSY